MTRIICVSILVTLVAAIPCSAQVTTSCSLYGNTAQCTSYDNGAVAAETLSGRHDDRSVEIDQLSILRPGTCGCLCPRSGNSESPQNAAKLPVL